MRGIIKTIITAGLAAVSIITAYAENGVNGSSGIKMIYSEDEEVSQKYYKPFAVIGWSDEMFDISASYYRWVSYSISDELFNTREIEINQPGADITISAGNVLSISGGYSYMSGSSSYTARKVTGEIILDFAGIDISADSSIKNTEYDFNGTIKNSAITAGGEISFDITDSFSWDIGYQREYTDYKTYGYIYTKNSGRIGILAAPAENFFCISGITGSSDSDGVRSAAFDAGVTLKLFKHLKLSGAYMFTAEFIDLDELSSTSGRRKSTTASSGSTTETRIIHTGNIAVSLYF
jgi:hypothetical protein